MGEGLEGQSATRYVLTKVKNPYGAGNPYSPSSPTNLYARGLRIEGR